MTQPEDTSQEKPLDERLRALDPGAFEAFVELSRASLWRLALGMMGSREHAEDVLQECYIKAYTCLSDGRWDGREPKAWSRTVLSRIALGKLRRRKRWRTIFAQLRQERPPPPPSPDATGISPQLLAHLEVLPAPQRVALMLVALEGATTQEVADTLGKSQGAAEQLLVRARRTLRERIDHAP